jgi:hypothetical protein
MYYAALLCGVSGLATGQDVGELVNAKDFGVTAGITDTTAALQTAVTFVAVHHRRLWIPAGSYHITSPIHINNSHSLSIVGDGPNATSIFVDADNSAFLFTGVCSKIELRDLWIGSSSARSAGYGIAIVGRPIQSDTFKIANIVLQNLHSPFYADGMGSSTISNVRIINTAPGGAQDVGMYFHSAVNVTIRDVQVGSIAGISARELIVLDSGVDTFVMENIQASGSEADGVLIRASSDSAGPRIVRLRNCSVSNTLNGIAIRAGRGVRLAACHVERCAASGVLISAGNNISLSNVTSYLNGNYGYLVTGGKGIAVENSSASNNSQAGDNLYDGCRLGTGAYDTRLIGNRFGDFVFSNVPRQRYGLSIAAATDNVVATGNILGENKTGALHNVSTGKLSALVANIP